MKRSFQLLAVVFCLHAQSVPVPPNLKVSGIPAIPAALSETIARYNEGRSANFLGWHPVKREILISTRFGDVPQIHRVKMPGGARTQLTFFSDRTGLTAQYRPPAGDWFLFSKDSGGGEFFQYFIYDTSSGESRLITDGKSRNTGAHWSSDGRLVVYSSTRRNRADTDLYIADPSDPSTTRLLLQVDGGAVSVDDWSPDGATLLISESRGMAASRLYLLNRETGAKKLLVPESNRVLYASPLFSKDGKGIYLATTHDSEFHRLAYLDLETKALTFLLPDLKWDAGDLALSNDGTHLAFTVNEDGADKLHVLRTTTRQEVALPPLPLGVIGGVRWHSNGRDLGFSLGSARSPSDVYSIDIEKGSLDRWTASETGGMSPENFSEPELIRWKSFDGRTISGFLYSPPKRFEGPRPVMINIHGGPASQSRPGFLGRGNYYLNELGVALIYPNVRGSTGYGKTFLDLDNGAKREDSVKDIGALLDWIAARKELDAARVMVTGGSYGSYMTLASMVHYNARLRCGVDAVGISNWVTFLEHTESYRRDSRRREYGDERKPEMREFLLRISPANHSGQISKPMFIIAGRNDPRVPASEGEQMVAAIRAKGGTAWHLVAEDEGHGFAKKKNQDFLFASTVLFVRQHLLN